LKSSLGLMGSIATPQLDLAGWWSPSLDPVATGNRVEDLSGNSNAMELIGTDSSNWFYSEGLAAISFDGSTEYGVIPSGLNLLLNSDTISISMWVRTKGARFQGPFITGAFSAGVRFAMGWLFGSVGASFFNGSMGQWGTPVTAQNVFNQWDHYVSTYDRTSLKLYKNGVLVSESSRTDPMVGSETAVWRVGRRWDMGVSSTHLAPIDWDDLKIFSRVLSDSEILNFSSHRGA